MAQSIVDGDLYVRGNLISNTQTLPAGTVTDTMVNANADIAATKLEHQFSADYWQVDGTDVAAATAPIHTVYGAAGTIVAFQAVCVDAPEGGDKKFTVDLKKASTSSTTLATVLTAAIDYTAGTSDYTIKSATISTATLVAGETLHVVVTPSGSTGNQGQGLVVTTVLRENPV